MSSKTAPTDPPAGFTKSSKAEVFVFESLSLTEEAGRRYDGLVLTEMLRLAYKNPKYYYFQTKNELTHLAGLFQQSDYRYLHISCHGGCDIVKTTNETLSYDEFACYLAGTLNYRRLFLSACTLGNMRFISAIARHNPLLFSIVAPVCDVDQDQVAAFWSAFYVSMFGQDGDKMSNARIQSRLRSLCNLLALKVLFAYRSPDDNRLHYRTYSPK